MNRFNLGRTLLVVAAILRVGFVACGIIGVILGSYGVDIHIRWVSRNPPRVPTSLREAMGNGQVAGKSKT